MVILDNKKNIRSFGRINGRGKINKDLLKNITCLIDENYKLNKNEINHLEIGFGYGESLLNRAINNKNINYIGCETYIKGVLSLYNCIKANNINNIKIFNGDARILLENIEDETLDMIFILFPDPWPKKKQNKRRIISDDFLSLIEKKLKKGGKVFFATDIESYVEWTIEKFNNNKSFSNNKKNIKEQPEWWITTKYQDKAIKEGRDSNFLEYIKK